MPRFALYGRIPLKDPGTEIAVIGRAIARALARYYHENDIAVTNGQVNVDGNLRDFWERAITVAVEKFRIEDGHLVCAADGIVSFGNWPWLWFGLGFFTGIFFGFFMLELVEYLLCRDRPARYLAEMFKAIEFEFG